jgi:mannosyltransferase OCH1-like enzyme
MVFTWFGGEMPSHFSANMNLTVDVYRREWNDSDAPVHLLDTAACLNLLAVHYPKLIPYFGNLRASFKSDICRVAELYARGGYYFDVDMLAVWPYVPRAETTTVLATCADNRPTCYSQSFLASEPGRPILMESLQTMHMISTGQIKTPGYGTAAMSIAHQNVPDRRVHVLRETHAVSGIHEPWALQLPQRKKRYCNYVVHDADVLLFYSRVYGTGCGFPNGCN